MSTIALTVATDRYTPKPYYSDELVTLYCGDCREITAWLAADVLVTDPPYGIGWSKGENKAALSKAHAGIVNDEDTSMRDWAIDAFGKSKPGIVFGAWSAPFPQHNHILIWEKPVDAGIYGTFAGFRRDTELIFLVGKWPHRTSCWSSVLRSEGGKARYLSGHPHAKPVPILRQLIEATDGMIADPFAGRGPTLLAAKSLGRRAIGVEIDERHCEAAALRLSQGVMQFEEATP